MIVEKAEETVWGKGGGGGGGNGERVVDSVLETIGDADSREEADVPWL